MKLVRNLRSYQQRALKILESPWDAPAADFSPMVMRMLAKRERLLELVRNNPTPFYVLDNEELDRSIGEFRTAFEKHVPGIGIYYAMKVNHHPAILSRVVSAGFGIDVSSSKELLGALKTGAQKIIFTGPGKTKEDLELALAHSERVTVNIDSFGELDRLAEITRGRSTPIRAGVRVYGKEHGDWSKFGIKLDSLRDFWLKAVEVPGVSLQGIQFHCSWNRDGRPYGNMIRELALYLRDHFSPELRSQIQFVDFGGGFRPYRSEGFYPWKVPAGQIIKVAGKPGHRHSQFVDRYYMIESQPISAYARSIGTYITRYLRPLVDAQYYTEPGRVIANNAMHILLSVVDVKGPNYAIMDGGINLVGWERFEHDYFPLLNLTHPSPTQELDFELYGPLCMPQDTWGYYVYAEQIAQSDVVLVPYQGALTYSLAQDFIKPVAGVVELPY